MDKESGIFHQAHKQQGIGVRVQDNEFFDPNG